MAPISIFPDSEIGAILNNSTQEADQTRDQNIREISQSYWYMSKIHNGFG